MGIAFREKRVPLRALFCATKVFHARAAATARDFGTHVPLSTPSAERPTRHARAGCGLAAQIVRRDRLSRAPVFAWCCHDETRKRIQAPSETAMGWTGECFTPKFNHGISQLLLEKCFTFFFIEKYTTTRLRSALATAPRGVGNAGCTVNSASRGMGNAGVIMHSASCGVGSAGVHCGHRVLRNGHYKVHSSFVISPRSTKLPLLARLN